MGLYQGEATWRDDVYQFELTDVVQGGPTGIDNKPLKELADRTTFLKAAMRGYFGATVVNAARTFTVDEINNKLVMLIGTAAFPVSLPPLSADVAGMRICFISQSTKQITINATVKINSEAAKSLLVIAEGEKIELFFDGTDLHLLDHSSNIFNVGDFGYGYKVKKNAVVANGALLLRADYPRLFEYVQSLQGQNSVVSETVWNTQPGNKGFFTLGTNSSNFRVPDLRSMFIRGLDLGAGITYGRQAENPGGYEADELKSHNHQVTIQMTPDDHGGSGQYGYERYAASTFTTTTVGGAETRPKNIGLIPYLLV
jgi:hypothetical protein